MLALLIGMIIALFTFLGAVAGEAALPSLQNAQDEVVAALTEALSEDEDSDSDGDNGENGEENNDEDGEDGDENGDEDGETVVEATPSAKVAAYNAAAGFAMPNLLPAVAIDKSPVLLACDEEGADCEDKVPGKGVKKGQNAGNQAGLFSTGQGKSKRP
ncbi:MAG: hypothetical protein A2864_01960 [Candidatus Woykebacteria bacterium RIFCSPHIGHO2_01_FULL_39_12]|uniref:Uncharacterized protein n=1 Tax=Candidatus Woykebacteria bacterium RIFCSPHIGHO2_01_FULL_39_12 TaxID=1802599 RepID=A0A1G1WK92_9BACT|nr:MAG: hypothetical protein A2864_01960 [Candidatus Woykebacteria bacterium RIFCSPHIGHO2_01_FULL_39_12]